MLIKSYGILYTPDIPPGVSAPREKKKKICHTRILVKA